jgi:uncharacterized protein YutE (UPF0331/DUF86 family)
VSMLRLDPGIVHARLGVIRELVHDLEDSRLDDADALRQNRLLRHAVDRVLARLVENAVAINCHIVGALGQGPRNDRESFRSAVECGVISRELASELEPTLGLHNLLVQEWFEVEQVAAAVPLARDGYRRYLAAVAAYVSGS